MWQRIISSGALGLISLSPFLCLAPPSGLVSHPANMPIEDRFVVSSISSARLAAVFDGHGGWQVSDFLHKHIKSRIESYHNSGSSWPSALTQAFDSLESELADAIRGSYKLGFGKVAAVGACAIVALVLDTHFIVANAGDCQAILVSSNDEVIVGQNICDVHSSNLKSEQEKLASEHPGELDIVRCRRPKACYVKGRLMPTRAFGDFHLKFEEFNNPDKYSDVFGFNKSHIPKFTGPYITHEPDVKVKEIREGDKYLVLASDGLWDELTEQQAAEIVMKATNAQEAAEMLLDAALNHAALDNGMTRKELNELPFGKKRSYHDDITIVVVPL